MKELNLVILFLAVAAFTSHQISAQDADFRIKLTGGCDGKADIVFIVDASSSVKEYNFKHVLDFIAHIVEGAQVDEGNLRFGMLSYSTDVYPHFHLNTYKQKAKMLESIHSTPYNFGSTNTAGGIKMAHDEFYTARNGDRAGIADFAVVITDGQSNIQKERTIPEADAARSKGIHIFGVGVNLKGKIDELKAISNHPPEENMFLADDFQALNAIKKAVFKRVCEAVVRVVEPATDPPTRPPTPKPTPRPTIPPRRTRPPPRIIGKCSGSADIAILIDTSGSVGHTNFERLKSAALDIIDTLDIDNGKYRVALMTFSSSTKLVYGLDDHNRKEAVRNATRDARYIYGSTNTAAALRRMRDEIFTDIKGDRSNVENVCILMTDGRSNIDHYNTIPEARRARDQGIAIIGVGIGLRDPLEVQELEGVVGETHLERMISALNFRGLATIRDRIIDPMCNVPDPCASNPCLNGGGCTKALDTYVCSCRKGYTGYNCERECKAPLDVVFLIESSNRVGSENFDKLKGFMKEMLRQVNLGNCDFRVGAMKFGSNAMIQFNLNDFTSNVELREAVDDITYVNGATNIGHAIKIAQSDMFTEEHGDRKDVANMIVLLFGGKALLYTEPTMKQVRTASKAGIHILPIGIETLDTRGLVAHATDRERGYFIHNSYTTVTENVLPEFLEYIFETRDQCATKPCQNRGTCTDTFGNFKCECPAGYSGVTCQNRCFAKMDVALTIDVSSYMTQEDLGTMKDFLVELVQLFGIKGPRTKVAIVTYGRDVKINRKLSDTDDLEEIIADIEGISLRGGWPRTMDAVGVTYEEVFSEYNGDRENVPNYMVLVSGGIVKDAFYVDEYFKEEYKGMHIYGLGATMNADDEEEISKIITNKDDYSNIHANTTKEDRYDVMTRIKRSVCDDPDQCDELPCLQDAPCVDLVNDYYCECPSGFSGKNCEEECRTVVDLVFALDSSGSVGQANFQRMVNFVNGMVDIIKIGYNETRVGLVVFSNRARPVFYLDKFYNRDDIKKAVTGSGFMYGETFTADAIHFVRQYMYESGYGDRSNVPNVVIMITDGESNIQNWRTLPEAQLLKDSGAHIYSIGVDWTDDEGRKTNQNELRGMASPPYNENTFHVDDFHGLQDLKSKLGKSFCSEVDMCDTDPCENDGRCSDSVGTSYICTCEDGFSGDKCQTDCTQLMDIAFMIDTSVSVGNRNFERIKEFVIGIIQHLEMRFGQSRVSVSTFSDETMTAIYFNQYRSKEENIAATLEMAYMPGHAFTADALMVLRRFVFNPGNGERPDAPDVAVLITDGPSSLMSHLVPAEANRTKEYGIEVFGIGIDVKDDREMKMITTDSDHILGVDTWQELEDLQPKFIEKICQSRKVRARPTTTTTTTTPKPTTTTPRRTTPRRTTPAPTPAPTTPEPETTTTPTPEPEIEEVPTTTILATEPPVPKSTPVPEPSACGGKADVLFALDASDGLSGSDFKAMLIYIDSLIREIGMGNLRVGLMTFGDTFTTNFYLNEHFRSDDISNALLTVNHIGGKTNVVNMVEDIYTTFFKEKRGDRPEAPNMVVFIVGSQRLENRWEAYRTGSQLRKRDVHTVTLSIGATDPNLWRLSQRPNTITVGNTLDAPDTIEQFVTIFCQQMRKATR